MRRITDLYLKPGKRHHIESVNLGSEAERYLSSVRFG